MTDTRAGNPTNTKLEDSHDPLINSVKKVTRTRIDFGAVNAAAMSELPTLLARWLPDGRVNGREFEACNPRRGDRHPGSFRVNLRTGRWPDFATGDEGGDPVSFAAYLFGLSQIDAAQRLANMLGVH